MDSCSVNCIIYFKSLNLGKHSGKLIVENDVNNATWPVASNYSRFTKVCSCSNPVFIAHPFTAFILRLGMANTSLKP